MLFRHDEVGLAHADRLATFEGHWTDAPATARQLAAIGHVSDRPPLETLQEGSRCIACSHFVHKSISIVTLEGDVNPERFEKLVVPEFHKAGCVRLQVRLPFDTPRWFVDSASKSITSHVKHFEAADRRARVGEEVVGQVHKTSFFSLPIETRLQIYECTLPCLDSVTEIVQIERDSMRVTTAQALRKPRPHDPTQSSILRVCRTTHVEVLDLVFSHTTFTFASSKLLYMFLRRIGRLGRSLLRSIDLRCGQREDAIAFALLSSCEALRYITLRLPRAKLMPSFAPLWIQDGVASLLSLSGLEHVQLARCEGQSVLDDRSSDALLIRRELTRPRGMPSMLSTVNGILDI